MKAISFGVLVSSLFISSAFAQDYIKCEFKIPDNKVSCPLIGRCPQKILRESTTELGILVDQGQEVNGKISLTRVVLFPGTKKEDKNDIILFKDDKRVEKIKEKEIDHVQYDIASGIDYSMIKIGDEVKIHFKTPDYKFDLLLRGNGELNSYLLLGNSSIGFYCQKQSKEVYQDALNKKEALQKFEEEKNKESSSRQ